MSDVFELTVDGEPWQVASVTGHEAVGETFSFEVVARPENNSPADIGAKAVLKLARADGSVRQIQAIVDAVSATSGGATDRLAARGATEIRLVPRLALLADGVDHAVFLDQDALQIAEEVLSAHGFRLEKRCARTPDKRPQRVQAFESHLAFVTRILAEEGILWFLHPDETDVLVAADNPSAFHPLSGEALKVRASRGLLASERSAWAVGWARRIASDKVTLRDFDFEAPKRDLTVEAKTGGATSERYEYRGRFTDPSVGRELAQIRLEEHRRDASVLTGTTSTRDLVPGGAIDVAEAPIDQMNATWIVTRVRHGGHDRPANPGEPTYTATFEAVPKGGGCRPQRQTQTTLPIHATVGFGGVETMDVTGSSGTEIHTESYGRSKARFRWERTRPADDTSSAWLRSVQPPTSGGFFLPRVGWQVLTTSFQGLRTSRWSSVASTPGPIHRPRGSLERRCAPTSCLAPRPGAGA